MTQEAIAEYQKAIQLDSRLAVAHYDLGVMLAQQKRNDEAIARVEPYLDLKGQQDPKEADIVRKHIKELGGTPRLDRSRWLTMRWLILRCAARPSAPCAITCTRRMAFCTTCTRSSGTRRGGCRSCSPRRRWRRSRGATPIRRLFGGRAAAPPTVREIAGDGIAFIVAYAFTPTRRPIVPNVTLGAAGRLVAGARRARARDRGSSSTRWSWRSPARRSRRVWSALGFFHYRHPDLGGVPRWLPGIYLHVALVAPSLERLVAKSRRQPVNVQLTRRAVLCRSRAAGLVAFQLARMRRGRRRHGGSRTGAPHDFATAPADLSGSDLAASELRTCRPGRRWARVAGHLWAGASSPAPATSSCFATPAGMLRDDQRLYRTRAVTSSSSTSSTGLLVPLPRARRTTSTAG